MNKQMVLELFYTSPMLGKLQQTKELCTSKIITLSLKIKKTLKNLELFSNFKCKINLNK